MPPFAGSGRGAPLDKRSRGELVAWVVIFPLVGVGVLGFGVYDVVAHSHGWGFGDWLFRVGWVGCVGLVLGVGLPGAAWRELRRRKRADRTAEPPQPPHNRG